MTIADTARSLLALCEEATPGPWVHVPERAVDVRTAADKMIAATWTDTVSEYDPRPSGKKDGAYIAACAPETIAQLCRAYLDRERDAELLRAIERDHPAQVKYYRHAMSAVPRCDDHYDEMGRQCVLHKWHDSPHEFAPQSTPRGNR